MTKVYSGNVIQHRVQKVVSVTLISNFIAALGEKRHFKRAEAKLMLV